ncbi:hypothetical protein Rhopal_002344-T1 [Rhodotorula paludigena]|uniref:enoyl-[acyl-carrier-protein] reductase n=1 Tax=Rhodotorula paludigena TaxID=86838 RepID=A0AAV5GFN7_9BASI|nr:hypothetical protein Rhopal_002344-T1 [Rhodotorula paludigena]
MIFARRRARTVVFAEHGDPAKVLRAHRYRLPKLDKGQVRLRFELGAVNPADINVIQGVYPSKPQVREDIGPEPVSIMGNEGVATVEGFEEDGEVENKLKVGDRVVMGAPQLGTWQSHANIPFSSLIPLPASSPLSLRQAATLAINPPTAWRMLSDFVPLNPEEPARGGESKSRKKQWVIQNGANSAVGVAVIQLAREWGVGTINLVRDRPSIDELKQSLTALGADHVLTYDEFLSRDNNTRQKIKEWVGKDGELRLALNCVGGKETAEMAKLLAMDGRLVTYGGMAKTALALPPSLFIFKRLVSTGFWLSNWVQTHPSERQTMMQRLAALVHGGKLREPETEVVSLAGTDEEVAQVLRNVMTRVQEGRGKKVLLHWKDE